MSPENPWIDATLESFPEGDPKNPARRERLIEASTATPPDWTGELEPAPLPQKSLSVRGRFRHYAIDLILLVALGVIAWSLCISPAAHYRLRGIAFADRVFRSMSETSLSGPLASWTGGYFYDGSEPVPPTLEKDFRRRIPAGNHKICLGEQGARSPLTRWASFWSADPSAPSILADQARTRVSLGLPIDAPFLQQAELHDSNNGYYQLLLLHETTEDCLSESRGSGRRGSLWIYRWKIDDIDAYEAAWERFEAALASETINSRATPIIQLQLADYPPPSSYSDLAIDQLWSHHFLPKSGIRWGSYDIIKLFSVRAETIAATGKVEDMKRLCDQWRSYIQLINDSEWGGSWVTSASLCSHTSAPMQEVCSKLGMTEEEKFFAAAQSTGRAAFAKFRGTWPSPDASTLNWQYGSGFKLAPRPGRLAEHRMFESLYLTTASAIIVVITALFSFLSLFRIRRTLGLPIHLTSLLNASDHLRVMGLGLILPATVVLTTLEVPYLHPRVEVIDSTQAVAVLLKFAALIVGSLLLMSREVILALARRGRPLGFGPTASLPLLFLGLLALACAPAASALVHLDSGPIAEFREWIWIGFFSLLGLILLLFFIAAATLISKSSLSIQMTTASHILTRHLVIAAVLFGAWALVDRAIESKHVSNALAERIDTPFAMKEFLGQSPRKKEIRQIFVDYLDTAPKD